MGIRHFWKVFAIVVVLLVGVRISSADNHQTTLIRAIEQAEAVGAYSYRTDLIQTTRPLPKLINLGLSSTEERFEIAGSVNLPEEELYLTLTDVGGVIEVQVDEDGAFGRLDPAADWQPLDDFDGGLFAPGQDSLAYLHAAENVTFVSSDSRAGLSFDRYTFDLNGETFAAHVRTLMEEEMRRNGELPRSLRLETSNIYAQMEGAGEIWIGANGLPIRQIINATFPESNTEQVSIELSTEFFGWDAQRVAATQPFWEPLRLNNQQVVEQATFGVVGLAVLAVGLFTLMSLSYRQRYRVFAIVIVGTMVFSPVLQIAESAEIRDYFERNQPEEEPLPSFEPVAEPFDSSRNPLSYLPDFGEVGLFSAEISSPLALFAAENDSTDNVSYQVVDRAAADADNDRIPDDKERKGCENKADCDGDGLTDFEENVGIGTLDNQIDSDGDGLSDLAEVRGINGKYTNPLEVDTNGDGLPDGAECSEDASSKTLRCPDQDNDGTLDVFDFDNDGDGVPDSVDLSVDSKGTTIEGTKDKELHLSINDLQAKPVTVNFQIRPTNPRHLWLSRTILDWPEFDTLGNVTQLVNQTLGNSGQAANGDTRAVPMLELTIPFDTNRYGNLPTKSGVPAQRVAPPAFPAPKTDHDFNYEWFTVACHALGYKTGATDAANITQCANEIWNNTNQGKYKDDIANWQTDHGEAYVQFAVQCHLAGFADVDTCKNDKLKTWIAGWLDAELLKQYGVSVRPLNDKGDLLAYIPLQLVYDEFNTPVAFAGTMAYLPQGGWGSSHNVRLVWSIQVLMQEQEQSITRTCAFPDNPGKEYKNQPCPYGTYETAVENEPGAWKPVAPSTIANPVPSTVITYDDDWLLTGLSVREDHDFAAALVVENPTSERTTLEGQGRYYENELWQLADGLGQTFLAGVPALDLAAVEQRWRLNSTASEADRWSFPANSFIVERHEYPTQLTGLQNITQVRTEGLLAAHFIDRISKPVVMTLYEETYREVNLDALSGSLNSWLALSLRTMGAEPTPNVRRGLKFTPYERVNNAWQAASFNSYYDHLSLRLDAGLKDNAALRGNVNWSNSDVRAGAVELGRMYFVGNYVGHYKVTRFGNKSVIDTSSADKASTLLANVGVKTAAAKTVIERIGGEVAAILESGPNLLAAEDVGLKVATGAQISNEDFLSLLPTGVVDDDVVKQSLKQRALSRLKNISLTNALGALGGLAVVGTAVVGSIVSPSKKSHYFHASNTALQLMNTTLNAFGVKDAIDGFKEAKALKSALNVGGDAASGAAKSLKAAAKSAKVGAIIGLVLDVGIAIGVFATTLATGGDVGAAIAGLIAALFVAVLLFTIAVIPVIGQIIVAIIGLIDGIIAGICAIGDWVTGDKFTGDPNNPAGAWACKGIANTIASALSFAFYGNNTAIDMGDADRLSIGNFQTSHADPDAGPRAGNTMYITLDLALNPKEAGLFYTGTKHGDDVVFSYEITDEEKKQETYGNPCLTTPKVYLKTAAGCAEYEWKYIPTGERTDADRWYSAQVNDIKALAWKMEAGLNQKPAAYLTEYSLVPSQKNVTFVFWESENKAVSSIDLTDGMYFDVFPATLDGFFEIKKIPGSTAYYSTFLPNNSPIIPLFSSFTPLLDADGDGLRVGSDPDDGDPDTDDDGLSDFYEIEHGTDPRKADSDNDGLDDKAEIRLKTDPNSADSDNDGLNDFQETNGWAIIYNANGDQTWTTSNPWNGDTDGDTFTDAEEKAIGFNPNVPNTFEFFDFTSRINDADGFFAPDERFQYVLEFRSRLAGTTLNAAFDTELPPELTSNNQPYGFLLKPSDSPTKIVESVTVGSADSVNSGAVDLTVTGIGTLPSTNSADAPVLEDWAGANSNDYGSEATKTLSALTRASGKDGFTAQLWVKPQLSNSTPQMLLGNAPLGASGLKESGFLLYLEKGTGNNATIHHLMRSGDVQIIPESTTVPIADGKWHLVTYSLDWTTNRATLYIDGVEAAGFNIATIQTVQNGNNAILHYNTPFHTEGMSRSYSTLGKFEVFDYLWVREQHLFTVDFDFDQRTLLPNSRLPNLRDNSPYQHIIGCLDTESRVGVSGNSAAISGYSCTPDVFQHRYQRSGFFQGDTDSANIGYGSYTVGLWLFAEQKPSESLHLVKHGPGNRDWGMRFGINSDGKFYTKDSSQSCSNQTLGECIDINWNTAVELNKWSHYTLRYDDQGRTYTLFVNGQQVEQKTDMGRSVHSESWQPYLFSSPQVSSGGTLARQPIYIDEVKLSPLKLTDDEIVNLYNAAPLLYVPFDERGGATTFVGSGVDAANLTCSGDCPAAGVQGKIRRGVQFDSAETLQAATVPNAKGVSFWINPDQITNGALILARGSDVKISFHNNTIACFAGNQAVTSADMPALNVGEWNFVSIMHYTVRQFVEYNINGKTVRVNWGGQCLNSNAPLTVGGGTAASHFDGKLDDLQLFRQVLLPEQTNAVYEAGRFHFSAEETHTITIDDDNPTLQPLFEDYAWYPANAEVVLGASVADATSSVVKFEWRVGSTGALQEAQADPDAPGVYLFSLPPATANLVPTENLFMYATDAVGHRTQVSPRIRRDSQPPTVAVTAFTQNAETYQRQTDGTYRLAVSGTFDDGAGIGVQSIEVKLLDAAGGQLVLPILIDTTNDSDGKWEANIEMRRPINETVTVEAIATDKLGNVSSKATTTAAIESNAPRGSIINDQTALSSSGSAPNLTLPTISGFVADVPYPNNAALHLPFDAMSSNPTTFNDTSVNRRNATCSPCPAVIDAGKVGKGVRFAGGESLVWAQPDGREFVPNDFSFVAWVKPSGSAGQTLFEFGRDANHYMRIQRGSGNTLTFDLKRNGNSQLIEGGQIQSGQWNHVAVVQDNGIVILYINGKEVGSKLLTTRPVDVLNKDGKFWFGKSPYSTGAAPYQGEMDDVLVYGRALSADEITRLFNPMSAGISKLELGYLHVRDANSPEAAHYFPVNFTATNDPYATWTAQVPAGLEGQYRVSVRATDGNGNSSVWQPTWEGAIDTTAPRLYAITDVAMNGTDRFGRMLATDYNLSTQNAVNICGSEAALTRINFAEAWYTQFAKKDGKVIDRLYQLRSACAVTGATNTARACDTFGNCGSAEAGSYPGETAHTWGSAGNGNNQFTEISSIAVDPFGNIYVGDTTLDRIQKFDAERNYVTQWKIPDDEPRTMATDKSGNLIIGGMESLYRYSSDGELIASYRLPPPSANNLIDVIDVGVMPDGTFAVALNIYDKNTREWSGFVHRYDLSLRDLGRLVGSTDGFHSMDVDSEGNVYVQTDWTAVEKYSSTGQLVTGWSLSLSDELADLFVDDGDVIVVNTKDGVWRYTTDGDLLSHTPLTLTTGEGAITVNGTGEIFVADKTRVNHITPKPVQPLPAKPTFASAWRDTAYGGSQFGSIKFDSTGNVVVQNLDGYPSYQTITKRKVDGTVLWKVGTDKNGSHYLGAHIAGFGVDGNDNLYVPVIRFVPSGLGGVDKQVHIQVIDKDGNFVKTWTGAGKLDSPTGVAVDGSDHVYILENVRRIHKFDKDGNFIKTFDNSAVRALRGVSNSGFAVDTAGNIYVMGSGDSDGVVKLDQGGNLVSADFIPRFPGDLAQTPKTAMMVDGAGRIYTVLTRHYEFFQYAAAGTLHVRSGDKPTNPHDPTKPDGTFNEPYQLGVQPDGNHVIIVDEQQNFLLFKMGTPPTRTSERGQLDRSSEQSIDVPSTIIDVDVAPLVPAGVTSTLTVFASAEQPIKTVNITIDGNELYTRTLAASDNITTFVNLVDWIPAVDGDNLLTATVTDQSDNSAIYTATVRVDALSPEVTLDENVFNDGAAELGLITLSGLMTDTIGLRDLAVVVVETGVVSPMRWSLEQLLITDLDETTNLQRASWAGFWDVPEATEEIEYTAIITATDLVGHETFLTETLYVDVVAPIAPPTVTLTHNGVALTAGDVIADDKTPTFDLTWSASDSPDIASYEIYWQKLDADGNEIDFQFNELGASDPLMDTWAAVDGETISVTVTALDYAANRADTFFGTVIVDHASTPVHYGTRTQSTAWLTNSCNALGQDFRHSDGASLLDLISQPQRMYAGWDASGLHIGWTGADWSEDGDLWLYLDTKEGGSERVYDPYAATQGNTIVRLPVSAENAMLADYAIWVHEHAETVTQTITITNVNGTVETITETVVAHTGATLLRWDGSAWLVVSESSGDPTWTYQFNNDGLEPYTGFYLPFGDIGITDPVNASLKLLAFATEPDALHLWATAPASNLLNSLELVDDDASGDLHLFALLQNYAWESLGADMCPSGDGGAGRTVGLPAGAQNLSAEISSNAVGIGYALNGDNLSGFQADLLANLLDWNTLEGDLCSSNPDSPECRRELNAPDYHFADSDALAYLVGANHKLAGNGDAVTYSIRLHNRSTIPLSGVHIAVEAFGPVQLSTNDVAAGTLQPDEVRIVTIDGTINTSISDDNWASVDVHVLHAASTGNVEVEQLFYDIAVDQNAPSYVEVSNLRSTSGLGEQVVEGIVVDQSAVPQITVRVEINDIDAIDFTCTDDTPEDGAWTCPVTVNAQDNDTVRLTVRATDKFGQTSDWFEGLPLIADATPPVLTVDLQDGALLGVDDLAITGVHTDFDNAGYVEACLTINGQTTCDDVPFTEPQAALITTVSDSANAAIGACGGGELTRTFDVADELFVARAELQLSIDHPFRNDLLIKLTSPTGTEVTLVEHGAGANGLNVLLTDAAVLSVGFADDSADHILNATPNLRQPSPDALAAFIGENSRGDDGDNGNWTLSICDSYPSEDTGTYLGGELRLTRDDDQLLTDDAWAYLIDSSSFTETVTATLSFIGVDGVGNRSAAQTFDVMIDVIAPLVGEIGVDSAEYTRAITPTIRTHANTRINAPVSDDWQLASAILEAHTPNGVLITRTMTLEAGQWMYDDLSAGAADGDIFTFAGLYEIDILATDIAGNVSRSAIQPIEVIGRPDLIIAQSIISAGAIEPEDEVIFEVMVTNVGSEPSASTMLTHTLPMSTTFVSSTFDDGRDQSWTLPPLDPGMGITRTITIQIDASVMTTVTLTNTLTVAPVAYERAVDDNSADLTFTVTSDATAVRLLQQSATTPLVRWLPLLLLVAMTVWLWRRGGQREI